MSQSNLNDTAMTSSSSLTSDVNRVLRLNVVAKENSRYFSFPWKQNDKNNEKKITKIMMTKCKNDNDDVDGTENNSNSTFTNGWMRNIKKRLCIKNISLCKAKQKIKAIDAQRSSDEVVGQASIPVDCDPTQWNSRLASADIEFSSRTDVDHVFENPEADACWDSYLALGESRDDEKTSWRNESTNDQRFVGVEGDELPKNVETVEESSPIVTIGNIAEPQSTSGREIVEVPDSVEAELVNDSKAKANLSEELLKLSKYGWYWGPISGDEADSKLVSEPDGAFLVRDSSDDRYLLTLSFKSSGRLLHARMEHSGGLFSLCNQGDNEGFTSVAALIDHSMNSSQSAVFCYSRPRYPGHPSFPVRLTKPVSRFTQVRSLQYLCRFVIRQNTRLDNIHKLPLPKTIRGYIEEAHY